MSNEETDILIADNITKEKITLDKLRKLLKLLWQTILQSLPMMMTKWKSCR